MPTQSTSETDAVGVWTLDATTYCDWATAPVFTAEECEMIISIGNSRKCETAVIVGKEQQGTVEDSGYRRSEISWIHPREDTRWIFEKATGAVNYLNGEYFNFDLYGFVEGFQFTKYSGDVKGFYGKHVDICSTLPYRKLSIVFQLSDPADYCGGGLLLHTGGAPTELPRKRGDIAAFPSYVLHEVTPVTRGTRYSLVAWITGKPFR
jgi:PKHD-type hydroxylase